MDKFEVLPNRVKEVIKDVKKCTETLERTCSLLEDCIIILTTPVLVMRKKDDAG